MPTMVSFREDVTYVPAESTVTKTRHRHKPYLHQEHYLCDFYENIWKPAPAPKEREIPGSMPATRITKSKGKRGRECQQFVDIAQIAYAITATMEYREAYQPTSQSTLNIWGMALPSDGYEAPDEDDELMVPTGSYVRSLRAPGGGFLVRSTNAKPRHSTITEESRDSLATPHGDPTMDDEEEEEEVDVDDLENHDRNDLFPSEMTSGLTRKARPELVQAGGVRRVKSPSAKTDAPPLSADMAIPPPSKMNGSIVFSTVFMGEGEWGWSIRFLLALHEPVRHALFVMDRFLAQSHQQQDIAALEDHTREFFVWFNAYFVEYLNSQHEVKVNVLMPLIKVPFQVKQEITQACDDIYELLGQIQAQEHALLGNPSRHERASWLLRLDLLQKSIRRLNMTVHTVLNLEEKTLHVLLAEAFSEKTFRNYVLPRVFRVIKAKKVVVPWMIERSKVWGGASEQQSFQGMLPFSAKFLYKKVWRPYFDSNVAVAMRHMNEWEADAAGRRGDRRDHDAGCAVQ